MRGGICICITYNPEHFLFNGGSSSVPHFIEPKSSECTDSRKVMYVPELRNAVWNKGEDHVQLYGDRRETTIRGPPDLITRPKKAADGIESNRSSTTVTGSQREEPESGREP